ncbi:hypothetical protein BABINDRAFT_165167 [Babjeviella inositovora NRRL Y-12698]|uniref:STB6-like N-terminal domain-containing protein n=1 Tax=Babjeviella inositovora NRRL Y-12698 TaxID=984486 RepID=A0A1E3QVE9_9ASCO|nr:uncharacterized protein BABINDRAFT_165167 [Babjeviella inositovora NRRL Y-12698]ODQ81629.1 hypothetical protein BABINDRAFT_165167 [Babjeviella inositovora NRRL Y-12698]
MDHMSALTHYLIEPPSNGHRRGETSALSDTPNGDSPSAPLVSFVFPDFRSIGNLRRSLPRDFCATETVLLSGYEIYMVEQWACDRKLNTVVVTYTGNETHKIKGLRITIHRDKALWPTEFQRYFDDVYGYHSKPKETQYGFLFVTNISAFPSNLTLVPVPNGDIRTISKAFETNVDLRRVNCTGRAGLLLCQPSQATEHKFRQMFRVCPKLTIQYAVREIVLIVQITLYYFDMFDPAYGDGFLCNKTEAAINHWWDAVGTPRYQVVERATPGAGLNARIVSALLGTLLGIRSRLNLVGIDVPKDPYYYFDSFESAIGVFQRQNKLHRTRKLDPATLAEVYRASDAKLRAHQGSLKFTKAVKSTVQDISRLKRELVPACYETLDIEALIKIVGGRRLGTLWAEKSGSDRVDPFPTLAELTHQNKRELKKDEYYDTKSGSHGLYKSVDKLKLGLHNKKTQLKDLYTGTSDALVEEKAPVAFYKPAESCERTQTNCIDACVVVDVDMEQFYQTALHRRMSFPFVEVEKNFATTVKQLDPQGVKHPGGSIKRLKGSKRKVSTRLESAKLVLPKDQKVSDTALESVLNVTGPCQALPCPLNTPTLRRTHSFGEASDSILRYDYPFLSSPFAISQRYLKSLKDYKEFNRCYDMVLESDCHANYQVIIEDWQSQCNGIASRATQLHWQQATKTQQMGKLGMKMADIDSLSAKLSYELRVLGKRVVELEDNSTQFSAKLDVVAAEVAGLKKCYKIASVPHATQSALLDVSVPFYCAMRHLVGTMEYLKLRIDWQRVRSLWHKVDKNNHITNTLSPYLGYAAATVDSSVSVSESR